MKPSYVVSLSGGKDSTAMLLMMLERGVDYCLEGGFTWEGLYKVFNRVSCMCCPLSGIGHARLLRKHYPELWMQMLRMESWLSEGHLGRRFYNEITLSDLDTRFTGEDAHERRMFKLPGMMT